MNSTNRIMITEAGLKLQKQILSDLETERKKRMNTTTGSSNSHLQRNSWSQVDNSIDNSISNVDFILADSRTSKSKHFFKPQNSPISPLDTPPNSHIQSATPYFGQWKSQLLESSQASCSQTILSSFRKSVQQHSKDQKAIELYFTSKYKDSKYLRDKGKTFSEKISKSMELIKSERRQLQRIIKGQDIQSVAVQPQENQTGSRKQQKQLSQQFPQPPQVMIPRSPTRHHVKASSSMISQAQSVSSDGNMNVGINNSKSPPFSRGMISRAGSNMTATNNNTSDYSGSNSTSRIYDRIKELSSIDINERQSNAFLRLSEKMEKLEKKQMSYEKLRTQLDKMITRKLSNQDAIGFSPVSLAQIKNQHDNPQQLFEKDLVFARFQHKSKIASIQDKKYGRFWSKFHA